MSNAVVLNEKFENNGELALPASYEEIKGQGKLQPAPEQNHLSV